VLLTTYIHLLVQIKVSIFSCVSKKLEQERTSDILDESTNFHILLLSRNGPDRNRPALTVMRALWKIFWVGLTLKMVGCGFEKCNQRISGLTESGDSSYVYSIDLCSTISKTLMCHLIIKGTHSTVLGWNLENVLLTREPFQLINRFKVRTLCIW